MICPWDSYHPAVLVFCERNLCSWIREPANAWSSLAYVGVGIYVWFHDRKPKPVIRVFGIMAILIGLTSFAYHASKTLIGEILDLGSMYLFSCSLICLNLLRLGWLSRRHWLLSYVGLVTCSLLALVEWPFTGIHIFAGELILVGLLELKLLLARKPRADYRDWLTGVGLFLVSYAIWLLDFHHIVCDPDRHWLQGHAIWHVTNSFVFAFAYRFYSQFKFSAR